MSQKSSNRTETIARLNDVFRQSLGMKGQGSVVKTAGIDALSIDDQREILNLVRTFNDFSKDNDTYQEHDFGAFTHKGEKIFWKIDYYDKAYQQGSEDPADEAQTNRVLTVMFANEY